MKFYEIITGLIASLFSGIGMIVIIVFAVHKQEIWNYIYDLLGLKNNKERGD